MQTFATKWSICFLTVLVLATTAYGQTKRQIDNQVAFAKLYGYVRYFHPSSEAAAINWDRFAIYGSQNVENCKSNEELRDSLRALFKPMAPTLQIYLQNEKATFDKTKLIPADVQNYKTVAWQHAGVGFGDKNSLYKSARTNQLFTGKAASAKFAPFSKSIDVQMYGDKEFIFRSKVRLINGEGTGHLWARVDKPNKAMGFFDNMKDRPIKDTQWQPYEIKGRIDSDASFLVLGAMLIGDGELWVDDMNLQIKDGEGWKEVYANSFSEEQEGKAPQTVNFSRTLQDSYAFTVLKHDPDKNEKWISIKSNENKAQAHTTLFTQYPAVAEYVDKELGSELKAIIPLALYGTEKETYPPANKDEYSRLQTAIQAIPAAAITGNNLYTRLGNIAIAWNIFQHFYPYFSSAKTDWNKDLKDAITLAYSNKTDSDFHKNLLTLTAKLKDGHIRVNFSTNKALYAPPILWEWVQQQLVITDVFDTSLTVRKGDIVTAINGQNAREYFTDVNQYISAATRGWLEYRAQFESLLGTKDSELNLKVVRLGNSLQEVSLKRTWHLSKLYGAEPKKDTIILLASGIMYINIGLASMEMIKKALPQLQKSKAVICDLRGYPNGNHEFIEHLLSKKDTSAQWMQVPQIIYPDQQRIAGYEKHGWNLNPRKPHLDQKIVFLIDGQAISYAESYMSFIEHYKLATIVGQPTAGTNGNVNPFTLPGGYYISWTGMLVQKHNGTQHHGVGILPHVYVEKTIKGIRENKDEFLDKAIEIAGK